MTKTMKAIWTEILDAASKRKLGSLQNMFEFLRGYSVENCVADLTDETEYSYACQAMGRIKLGDWLGMTTAKLPFPTDGFHHTSWAVGSSILKGEYVYNRYLSLSDISDVLCGAVRRALLQKLETGKKPSRALRLTSYFVAYNLVPTKHIFNHTASSGDMADALRVASEAAVEIITTSQKLVKSDIFNTVKGEEVVIKFSPFDWNKKECAEYSVLTRALRSMRDAVWQACKGEQSYQWTRLFLCSLLGLDHVDAETKLRDLAKAAATRMFFELCG